MTDMVEIGDWCRLYHGDAIELMDEIRGVDAVVTDPRYGTSATWHSQMTMTRQPRAQRPLVSFVARPIALQLGTQ